MSIDLILQLRKSILKDGWLGGYAYEALHHTDKQATLRQCNARDARERGGQAALPDKLLGHGAA
jgi:hypothetical protein